MSKWPEKLGECNIGCSFRQLNAVLHLGCMLLLIRRVQLDCLDDGIWEDTVSYGAGGRLGSWDGFLEMHGMLVWHKVEITFAGGEPDSIAGSL